MSLRGISKEESDSETAQFLENLSLRGSWLDESIDAISENTVTTYKYSIISLISIILLICFFAAATAVYEKRNGSGKAVT